MDTSGIVMIILGVVLIAVGIFGKIRPDIVYRDWNKKGGFRQFGFSTFRLGGKEMAPEVRQRFGFVLFILMGVMFILVSVAFSIPQWQVYKSAILLSIIIVISVVLSFSFWKIILSQNERFKGISFAITMLFCFALIATVVYYWISILK